MQGANLIFPDEEMIRSSRVEVLLQNNNEVFVFSVEVRACENQWLGTETGGGDRRVADV